MKISIDINEIIGCFRNNWFRLRIRPRESDLGLLSSPKSHITGTYSMYKKGQLLIVQAICQNETFS